MDGSPRSRRHLQSRMHASHLRAKARQLRSTQKLSIDQISAQLQIPRTTIYGWVRDLPVSLTSSPRQTTAQQRGSRSLRSKYAEARDAAYRRGLAEASELLTDPHFRDFVVLYLAEGSKRNRNSVEICNSDPSIVRLALKYIEPETQNKIEYRVRHHGDQDPDVIRTFWASSLGVEPDLFKLQPKSNGGSLRGRNNCVHGIAAVRVGDTYLRARLQAWMDTVQSQWATGISE